MFFNRKKNRPSQPSRKQPDFDTYLPDQLSTYLDQLQLTGRTITNLQTASIIFRYRINEEAILDKDLIFCLDDGRKIGIAFCAVSHPQITLYKTDEEITPYPENELSIAEVFPDIINQKIVQIIVQTATEGNDNGYLSGYCDAGYDENQGVYIAELIIMLANNIAIRICEELDYMSIICDHNPIR